MDTKQLLQILLIITIPETAVMTWFCFRFFGIRTDRFGRKLALHTMLASVLLIISLAWAAPVFHPLTGILLSYISLSLCFRDLAWKSRIFLSLTCYMLNIFVEFSMVLIMPMFGGFMVMRDGPFYYKFLIWLVIGLFAAGAWIMTKRGASPGRRVMLYLQDDRHRHVHYYVIMIFMQALTLVLLFAARFSFAVPDSLLQWLFVASILIILIVSYYAVRLIANARDEAIKTTQDAFIGDLMQMMTTIRGQRHDFANHMQVMYSMLKMNKLKQLETYMADVAGEIHAVNRLSDRFPTTAFDSFLQAKAAIALERRIRFEYVLPELPQELSAVKNIDLVRIVGNLVDNAFDEVMNRPADQRIVSLQLEVRDRELLISVANAGEPLTEEVRSRIFTPGYSTKQGGHSGLGLPIVVERAAHYGGKVDVGYEPERGVVFTVGIPVDPAGQAS